MTWICENVFDIFNATTCATLWSWTVPLTVLTPLPLVQHIYASVNWDSIVADNGLSPIPRQAIIWTNVGISLIGSLRTKSSEILIEILRVSFRKMRLKGSSAKWRPFCLGLNVFNYWDNCRAVMETPGSRMPGTTLESLPLCYFPGLTHCGLKWRHMMS